MFPSKFVEEIKMLFISNNFFFPENRTVYGIMRKSIVEAERPQIKVWCMRIAYFIPKAINTL